MYPYLYGFVKFGQWKLPEVKDNCNFITDLPVEILCKIRQNLPAKDIKNLRLANTQMRSNIEPKLFWKHLIIPSDIDIQMFECFIQSVGKYCRSLNLTTMLSNKSIEEKLKIFGLINENCNLIESLDLASVDINYNEIKSLVLPHLQFLRIHQCSDLVQKLFSIPRTFSKLEKIEMRCCSLPHLRHLHQNIIFHTSTKNGNLKKIVFQEARCDNLVTITSSIMRRSQRSKNL